MTVKKLTEIMTDNYNVINADNFKKGYDIFLKNRDYIDAVISSVENHEEDERFFYRMLKKENPDLKYILSSKKEKEEIKYNADLYINKRSLCEGDDGTLNYKQHEDLKDIVFGALSEIRKEGDYYEL